MNRNNTLLLLGGVMFLILAYRLAISKTIEEAFHYFNIRKSIEVQIDNISKKSEIDKIETSLDQELKLRKATTLDFESALLKHVSRQTDSLGITLVNLKEPHRFDSEIIPQETFEIVVQGAFNPTLQFLNYLEYELPQSQLIHVDMAQKKRPRSRRTYLETRFLLSHFK